MKATVFTVKSLNVECSMGHQDVSFVEIVQMDQHKLRISIKSDSYSFQCHAQLDILQKGDNIQWARLMNIAPSAMLTPTGLCYTVPMQKIRNSPTSKAIHDAVGPQFMRDREKLIEIAKLILA